MKYKILFIACKQPDYSRIKLVRRSLEADSEVTCLFSEKSSYLMRIFDVCWRFFWMDKRAYDLVVIGFFAQLVFPFVRLVWRGKIVSDCFISLYDSLIFDRTRYREGGLVARVVHWLDGTMLRRSDLSLTDTNAHADYLANEFSIARDRIVSVPVSADEQVFQYTPAVARGLAVDECFEVLFYGAYIPLQGTDVIVRAAQILRDQPIRFRLVGMGQTYDETLQLAQSFGLDNVVFDGLQTLERLAELACESHLLLGIFGTTEKAARVIPNKVFEALSLGRPIVTGDSPAIRESFTDGENIMLTPFGDHEALAEKILWTKANYSRAVQIGCAGRSVFEASSSPDHVRVRLSEVVNSVLG